MHAFLNSELAIKGQMQVNFLTSAEKRDQTATSCKGNHGRGPSIKDVGICFRIFLYVGRFFTVPIDKILSVKNACTVKTMEANGTTDVVSTSSKSFSLYREFL